MSKKQEIIAKIREKCGDKWVTTNELSAASLWWWQWLKEGVDYEEEKRTEKIPMTFEEVLDVMNNKCNTYLVSGSAMVHHELIDGKFYKVITDTYYKIF